MSNMIQFFSRTVLFTLFACVFLTGTFAWAGKAGQNETRYEAIKVFVDVLEELEGTYVDEVTAKDLIYNAIKGMVDNLDPHSSFMPPEAFEELQGDTKGEFSGIGIVITMKEGILTVVSPIEGTPAYKAGIKAGDMIISIDGKSTKDMALWEAVNMMRGPRYDEVVLTVIRSDASGALEFALKRDLIPMQSVRSAVLSPGYGYLRVTNFRQTTITEIKEHLERLEKRENGLKGLILDLRDNPGGLLDQAAWVTDLFLEKGVIVSIKGRMEDSQHVYQAHKQEDDRLYPMVVLINGGSASASEIVAGALQDHSRALILGTTSFGKGSVQTLRPMRSGFGIKYTIARYYTPSGRSIQAKGIVPDITVEYEIREKKKKKLSAFDRVLREKDLKNSLSPEAAPENLDNNTSEQSLGLLDTEQLQRDVQVTRALDILISHGVFSKLNASK